MSVLKQIEPTAQEITKNEYENYMGIVPVRGESKADKDVRQPVEENPGEQVGAPLSRGAAIKILRERGLDYKDLKTKTKDQLIEMV